MLKMGLMLTLYGLCRIRVTQYLYLLPFIKLLLLFEWELFIVLMISFSNVSLESWKENFLWIWYAAEKLLGYNDRMENQNFFWFENSQFYNLDTYQYT